MQIDNGKGKENNDPIVSPSDSPVRKSKKRRAGYFIIAGLLHHSPACLGRVADQWNNHVIEDSLSFRARTRMPPVRAQEFQVSASMPFEGSRVSAERELSYSALVGFVSTAPTNLCHVA